MTAHITIFGQLTDITGNSLTLTGVEDTDDLMKKLHRQFPSLSHVKYKIAVNKKLINEKTVLTENCEIALLPPFSGG